MNRHVSAIILAAGLSKRIREFKPLLPLGGMTILERCIALFREAGIDDVRVVIGYGGEDLRPLLERLDVAKVANPRYREEMFSSVKAGLATIGSEVDSVFILPVDIPLVRPSTILRLLNARRQRLSDVVYPVFLGERGHPPLIAGSLAGEIVSWQGEGGLRQALSEWESTASEVCVADGNILLDMDTAEDYRTLLEKADRLDVPTPEECKELLEKVFCVGDEVIRHGRAVAKVAVSLAEALNLSGYRLDIPLIEAASLLHDIAKGEPDHARLGARRLHEEGFAAIAAPVAAHMYMIFSDRDTIGADQILYLADKMVRDDRVVSLEERFLSKQERYRDEPEILDRINGRFKAAQEIKRSIESVLCRSLEEILKI